MTPTPVIPTASEQSQNLRAVARRTIWLPFIVGVVLLIALAVGSALLPRTGQTSLIANFLLTFLMLCPLALCLFPLYILMVAAVYGMNAVNNRAAKPLMALERFTATLANRVTDASTRAARVSIQVNSRWAFLDKALFSVFDRPKTQGKLDEPSDTTDPGNV